MKYVISMIVLCLSLMPLQGMSKDDGQNKLEALSGILAKSQSEKDMKKLVKKAKKGNVEAQYVLAKKYEDGTEIPKDLNAAKFWYAAAAKNGHIKAKEKLQNIEGTNNQNTSNAQSTVVDADSQKKDVQSSKLSSSATTSSGAVVKTSGVETTANEKNETPKTFSELESLAKSGDAKSMYAVGFRLERGLGIQQDYKKSFSWYEKGAQKGNLDAMYRLSLCYMRARGVEKNLELSKSWLEKAAKSGHASSQVQLARTYQFGTYGVTDASQVVYWAKESAKNGDACGLSFLGLLYGTGTGVKQDRQLALENFDKSAVADRGECVYQEAYSAITGKSIFIYDENLRTEMLQKAVNQGQIDAQLFIAQRADQSSIESFDGYKKVMEMASSQGRMSSEAYLMALSKILGIYTNGSVRGVPRNEEMAVKIFEEEMSRFEKKPAMLFQIGEAFRTGNFIERGVLPVDNKKAFTSLIQAANQGNQDAMISVAVMYYGGRVPDNGDVPGYVKDIPQAIKFAESAASTGNSSHQANVGHKFLFGNDLPQDYKKAVKWLELSANRGNRFGQSTLGWYYGTVPHDYVQACKWYSLAGGNDKEGYGDRQKKIFYCGSLEPEQKRTAEKMISSFVPVK